MNLEQISTQVYPHLKGLEYQFNGEYISYRYEASLITIREVYELMWEMADTLMLEQTRSCVSERQQRLSLNDTHIAVSSLASNNLDWVPCPIANFPLSLIIQIPAFYQSLQEQHPGIEKLFKTLIAAGLDDVTYLNSILKQPELLALIDNPALLALVISAVLFKNVKNIDITDKRTRILSQVVGTTCGKSHLKLLSRIDPTGGLVNFKKIVGIIFANQLYLDNLKHLKGQLKLTQVAGLIELNNAFSRVDIPFCESQLIRPELIQKLDTYEVDLIIQLYADTVRMLKQVTPADQYVERLAKFKNGLVSSQNPSYLLKEHDQHNEHYTEILLMDCDKAKRNEPFPAPLVAPDNKQIIHIETPKQLINEGREMHHCAASYVKRLYQGECALYKFQNGENRGTIEILQKGDKPQIKQFFGACNKKMSEDSWKTVLAWFNQNSL
ncbi:MAG: hypothetical protein COA86_17855 [Kangiella sp.]|nr:MAG: hypothetical protein COA86_17855 [Kangiella sp.]